MTLLWYFAGAVLVLLALRRLWLRLLLSRAKHPSVAGHARLSRILARLDRYYEYDENGFFKADAAPPSVAAARQAGFTQLAELFAQRFAKGIALTRDAARSVSDLQFTSRYRVPFQFSRRV
ncbi:MAG: glutamate-1-semialdehyde 2,1-aminomutase, partial [Gammaproteobacteria bacterium]|nr:glutamate-1-semialdehyde 2,1-aminomutase [Gammaproteobacteria bacterium]